MPLFGSSNSLYPSSLLEEQLLMRHSSYSFLLEAQASMIQARLRANRLREIQFLKNEERLRTTRAIEQAREALLQKRLHAERLAQEIKLLEAQRLQKAQTPPPPKPKKEPVKLPPPPPKVVISTENVNIETIKQIGSNIRTQCDEYIDVADVPLDPASNEEARRTRGGVTAPFPERLHRVLNAADYADICGFLSHGRAFKIRDIPAFVHRVLPEHFATQTKWNSFARQLNLYGFQKIQHGPAQGAYYHELFLKGRVSLSWYMRRVGVPQRALGDRRRVEHQVKGTKKDPDFDKLPAVSSDSSNDNSDVMAGDEIEVAKAIAGMAAI